MNFGQILQGVLGAPHHFFTRIAKEKDITDAFKTLLILSIIPAGFGILFNVLWGSFYYSLLGMSPLHMQFFTLPWSILWGILTYAFLIATSFLCAGIVQIWCILFSGKGHYTQSYNLTVYAYIPVLLLGWIPFLGALSYIWNIVLLIIGTEKIHGINRTRAILMWIIPIAVLFVLWLILMVFFVFFVIALLPAMGSSTRYY